MAYDYYGLKRAWQSNSELGKWNGTLVYSCPKNELYRRDTKYFYIVFDDNNALVRDNQQFGNVLENGSVTEFNRPKYYAYPNASRQEKKEEVTVEEVNVPAVTVPLVDAGANEFFDRVAVEIDQLLKSDFNYET